MPSEPPTPPGRAACRMASLGRAHPPGRSLPGGGLGRGPSYGAWSHLPGSGHPAGPPAAPRRPAPAGRLGRWHRRRPSGRSHRSQHDLSPASPWPCWLDGDLWYRWRVADLLGPASRADRGIARPDLGGMTDHTGRHARPWVAGIGREVIGDCRSALWCHPACWLWLCVRTNGRSAPGARGRILLAWNRSP
jgi:hypothetical protein